MSKLYNYPCTDSTACHPITIDLLRGRYLIECYGAQGGRGQGDLGVYSYPGGKGAYASGVLNLKKTTTFYLYIGGKGEDGPNNLNLIAKGGWNGGGNSGKDTGSASGDLPDTSGAGGGCTDIRLIKATSNDANTANDEETTNSASLESRIIVAAGGSGASWGAYGAPGGDLTGYKTVEREKESYAKSDTTQTKGNKKGKGGDGTDSGVNPSSGAGAGYYGGIAVPGSSNADYCYQIVSSSGSSYVAGYPGCPNLPNDARYSVFGSQFISPRMFNGFSAFPSFNSEGTEAGHSGNGAVKITRLDFCSVCTEKKSNIILFCVVLVLSNNQKKKIKS